MMSKSMARRLQTCAAYPKAVCDDCSKEAGGTELPVDGSSWMGTCDVCWTIRLVNNPLVMGAPEFKLDAKHLARLSDH